MYRKNAKKTQAEFAELIEISTNYLSAIECGVKVPKLNVFLKMVNYLGVTPNELLIGMAEPLQNYQLNELTDKMAGLTTKDHRFVMELLDFTVANLMKNNDSP